MSTSPQNWVHAHVNRVKAVITLISSHFYYVIPILIYYRYMPIGKVWIYRLLFVCLFVCLCLYG